MAARTYVPGLRSRAQWTYRYITRWLAYLQAGLTPDQATALTLVITSLEALIEKLGPEPEEL